MLVREDLPEYPVYGRAHAKSFFWLPVELFLYAW